MNAAKVLDFEQAKERHRAPDVHGRVVGDGRAIAVAKFRELADKLESGELDGASVEWRDNYSEPTEMRHCTLDRVSGRTQLNFLKIEEG